MRNSIEVEVQHLGGNRIGLTKRMPMSWTSRCIANNHALMISA